MKTKNAFITLFSSFIQLALITMLLGCFSEKAAEPEKVCKLLFNGRETYEYNENGLPTQLAGIYTTKFIYDSNGFLIAKDNFKYEYKNGLLSKVTYPPGSYNLSTTFEYDKSKKLSKSILTFSNGTTVNNYHNGKIISTIVNKEGINSQPIQYHDGLPIRIFDEVNKTYRTLEYDNENRQKKVTNYDINKRIIGYSEYSYIDGNPVENTNPEKCLKGFPDEIKETKPYGLLKTLRTFRNQPTNLFIKSSEQIYDYTLNTKGYPTSMTLKQGFFNGTQFYYDTPTIKTYAYINCE